MSTDISIITGLLGQLHDSHLSFFQRPRMEPPDVDFGWQDQMIGDRCYITRVFSGMDAKAKGLKAWPTNHKH